MYSTGNHIQYLLITYNGTEYKKEYMYIYEYESFCYTRETITFNQPCLNSFFLIHLFVFLNCLVAFVIYTLQIRYSVFYTIYI